ncbi:unnamed protein product [Acanthoscelides obtectus]|uniref:Uncharacterized protein n=1 Tax=Acanthoscelides obtectus TaxID=200917 RepID=A0A9P0NUF7_ACAOB|nr:unnamed protein product [Acanthoscelides obtectus]CAK1639958.1 hypothetical protein AOBTE_LOCUS11474 [Acanthoscelides obtectus]
MPIYFPAILCLINRGSISTFLKLTQNRSYNFWFQFSIDSRVGLFARTTCTTGPPSLTSLNYLHTMFLDGFRPTW